MATRTSIELHPDECRVVEIVARQDPMRGVAVRCAASVADGRDASTLTEALARLRRTRNLHRRAWVTVWGLPSTPLTLPSSSIEDLRDHVRPIEDAGFVIEGVGTPALALTALARSRRGRQLGTTAAYLTIEGRVTCLALVRDGTLLFGRELPWGHMGSGVTLDEDGPAALKNSVLEAAHAVGTRVDGAILCGSAANLRTIAHGLGRTLGIPVETLDWADGVDLAASPELAQSTPWEVAALRLAVATGADPMPAENLLPKHTRPSREMGIGLRMVAAILTALLSAAVWYYMLQGAAAGVRIERIERAGSPQGAGPMADAPRP